MKLKDALTVLAQIALEHGGEIEVMVPDFGVGGLAPASIEVEGNVVVVQYVGGDED